MRALGILGVAALFLFMMATPAAYSQDNRDEHKPQAQEAPRPQDENAPRTDNRTQQDNRAQQNDRARQNDRAQQQEQQRQQRDRANENNRAQQDRDRNTRDQEREQHPVDNRPDNNRQMDNRQQDNGRMGNRRDENHQDMGRDQDRRDAADRGRHIPDDQFRSHFGREHRFHVDRDRVVNVSQPVIVYGGYSFELVDPWPAEWSYDDDCYIDYVDDGYYLFDVMHPGIRIAVFVVD